MGSHTLAESLVMRWTEMVADPMLSDLPYKVELNRFGTIEVNPPNTRHARLQGRLTYELAAQLQQGTVLTEIGILTDEGIRVPDVAWASADFMARHGEATPLPAAPELCVEVLSPSNTEAEMALKIGAYLRAGAVEVWIVAQDGAVTIHDPAGPKAASRFGVTLQLT